MRDTFNVLDEGWIPVVNPGGGRETLGIRELLRRAPELQAVSDASPLVEFGLYRLLTVFLMDALRPKKLSSLRNLLRAGAFDMEKIEHYIAECEAEGVSFDLLDEKRPFLQVERWMKQEKDKKAKEPEKKPASELDPTYPHGSNHTHFQHLNASERKTLTYAEAARLLPAKYLFCGKDGRGYSPGINGIPPYYMLIRGGNLFETLVLNLCVIDRVQEKRFDTPPVVWRYSEPIESEKEIIKSSFLLNMLFPARRIHLIAENGCIKDMYFEMGGKIVEGTGWKDPAVTYTYPKVDKKPVPLRPTHEKAIWRNLHEITGRHGQAPQILMQYRDVILDSPYVSVCLYGVETKDGKGVALFRHDLQVPIKMADDPEQFSTLTSAIEAAEIIADGLQLSLAGSRLADRNGKIDLESNPTDKDKKRWSDKLKKDAKQQQGALTKTEARTAVQLYYDRCEPLFWELCKKLMEDGADLKACCEQWREKLSCYAFEEWDNAVSRVHLTGRGLVTAQENRTFLYRCVKRAKGVK